MNNQRNEELYRLWEKQWMGSEVSERLTPLGRLMLKSKKRALKNAVSDLTIEKVIEVGCGLGYTLEFYHRAGFDCIGIDVSPSAIEVCKKKGLPVKQLKLEDLNTTYDFVSSDGMLEHLLNFEPYVQHLTRISRHYVLLIQPNHESFWGKTLVYLAELIRGDDIMFEYNYRIEDYIYVFSQYNFVVVKNLPVFFNVFRLLLFEKVQ